MASIATAATPSRQVTSPANARAIASATMTAAISHGERFRANSRRASARVLTSLL